MNLVLCGFEWHGLTFRLTEPSPTLRRSCPRGPHIPNGYSPMLGPPLNLGRTLFLPVRKSRRQGRQAESQQPVTPS